MPSTLVSLIEGACSPARYEPELSLNLEICEMINKKQGTAPREAATSIVKLVNSKNMNQAMLALTLLDNCVKNCGYPFHLQIATKEFLNELVRKFPERPAPFPSPVVQRILYLIKEWKVALTDMSKHKDDLIHIKDMYKLLRFKGYRFPELRDSSIAALAPSDTLKSAHELEEEDRLAQSAKLQELIRRGRPQDLVEANKLMKIMSGFDTKQTPDYNQKLEDELSKIQDKTILLYEMLETVKPGDKVDRNDTIMDLKNACASAQPKIQKMITEEEDTDKIENLLSLNDMINNVMAKYADIKKGIFDTHYDFSGKPPTQTDSTEAPKQGISLIDLDDEPSATSASTPQQQQSNPMNDLSDIFGSTSISSPPPQNTDIFGSASIAPPPQNTDIFGSASISSPPQTKKPDIFDLLGGGIPNTQPSPMASPSLFNTSTPPPQKSSTPSPTFSQPSAPKVNTVTMVNKNGLKIELQMKDTDNQVCQMRALFSNMSTAPMEKLMLRLAAPKSMQIKMEPQSSQVLPPKSEHGVTQLVVLNNPNKEPIRLRYKVSYEQFGVEMEQTGDFKN